MRASELTDEKIRRALGLTVTIAWGLGLLVLILGPVAADYYEIQSLALIFAILAASFFLAPFVNISIAMLSREFNFQSVFKLQLVSSLAAMAATIAFILADFSYYSLALGQVTNMFVQLAFIALSRQIPNYWRPVFSRLSDIARFGIYNSLTNLFQKGVNVVPDMVIGKLGTTAQVAMFSRGLGFVDFLSGSLQMGVTQVALPYFSEAKRARQSLTEAYTRATVLICGLVWPVLAVASVASLPVIRLFFGDQWDAAAPLTSVLAVWLILRATHHFANKLLIATGNERVMAIKEALLFFLIFALVIMAYPCGLQAVASMFVILGLAEIISVTWLLSKRLDLRVGKFYRALLPNLVVTIICALVTLLIAQYVDFEANNAWRPVGAIAVVLPPVWLLSLASLRHPLFAEIRRMAGLDHSSGKGKAP